MSETSEHISNGSLPDGILEPIPTVTVPVAELTFGELNAPSGQVDPIKGRELTVLEVMQSHEAETHGGKLITVMDERLSEESQRANRLLTGKNVRRGVAVAAALTTGVFAIRAIKDHRKPSNG